MYQNECTPAYGSASPDRPREVFVAIDQIRSAIGGLDHDLALLMNRVDPLRNRSTPTCNEKRPGRIYGCDLAGQIGAMTEALETLRDRVQDVTSTLEV